MVLPQAATQHSFRVLLSRKVVNMKQLKILLERIKLNTCHRFERENTAYMEI